MSIHEQPDPIRLEVFHHLLAAVCEEAGGLLRRTAMSVNIRERWDFSCALFDGQARLIAQAAHIPVHLGSAADSVRAVIDALELGPGDVAVLNDPYAGGTHLPDVTLVRPVFVGTHRRRPSFFLVDRAHHADIGGAVPGSMGVATDLMAEGLVIPPVKLRSAGRVCEDVLRLFSANVRGAAERIADLQAQEASLLLAEKRLLSLVKEYGLAAVERYAAHLMDYSERLARSVVSDLPKGTFEASDIMEDDGTGQGPFHIRLALTVSRRGLTFDFTGTDAQARGGINANPSVVLAACVYVLRCLCPSRLPTNEGVFRLVRILTGKGSLVDPLSPAPVAGGNVETSQRLVDVVLKALARALPGRIPAASAGTMSNLSVGGDGFSFYETLPGGAGAGPWGDGPSAVQTHMTNTRNTPIEETELRHPVQVTSLTIRRRSGGGGSHRGGDGLVKELRLLVPATVSLFSDRQRRGPPGMRGGSPGQAGRARMAVDRGWRTLPSKGSFAAVRGSCLRIETPGGGGWGAP